MNPKLAILISGRGSNMEAILNASKDGKLNAEPAVVIADKNADGLKISKEFGIYSIIIPYKSYPNREEFENAIVKTLIEMNIKIVVLAGFMKILSPNFFKYTNDMIILNIHPSLLPKFKGLYPQRQAIEAREKFSGCTVHYVTPELDSGEIIIQKIVEISNNDTEKSLSEKILIQEHIAYTEAINIVTLKFDK